MLAFLINKFSTIDKIIYKSIIIGIDHTNIVGINIPQVIKNKYRSSFPFHLKCLNLNEKKGISETKSTDIKMINGMSVVCDIMLFMNVFPVKKSSL